MIDKNSKQSHGDNSLSSLPCKGEFLYIISSFYSITGNFSKSPAVRGLWPDDFRFKTVPNKRMRLARLFLCPDFTIVFSLCDDIILWCISRPGKIIEIRITVWSWFYKKLENDNFINGMLYNWTTATIYLYNTMIFQFYGNTTSGLSFTTNWMQKNTFYKYIYICICLVSLTVSMREYWKERKAGKTELTVKT